MNRILSAAAVLALAAGASVAGPGHHKTSSKPPKAAAAQPLICPVTGNKIASVAKAVGHSTFKGKTYYFCCGMCKPKFDKNPQKYITNSAKGVFEKM